MTNMREALQAIVKTCSESSDFSRRIQSVLNTALIALGYTENQRANHFGKCLQRSEQYKETKRLLGESRARKELAEAVLQDKGEVRKRVYKKAGEEYV